MKRLECRSATDGAALEVEDRAVAVAAELVLVPLRLLHHDRAVAADAGKARDGAVFKLFVFSRDLKRSPYFGEEKVVFETVFLELLQR